ncbi:MAG: hypothetical protein GXY44_08715 [Phycisphaerales bacterium]|nr:hypothetical protein [Phycisphaerales bacterium]
MEKQQLPDKDVPETLPVWVVARGYLSALIGAVGVLIPVALLPGCSTSKLQTADRLEKGYVVVLPGIEGKSFLNVNIARGLDDGGVRSYIKIHDWTPGTLLLFPVTMRAESRNQRQARRVAQMIIDYQDKYPNRPVHLIGHSGGGGLAVFTLEALPPQRRIASAILLAPALAPTYDLSRALRRTEYGIYNYYSRRDLGFLGAGTTIVGTIDGEHTSAAGAVGFQVPYGLSEEGRELYRTRLHQQRYTPKMAESGHSGGHLGWADRKFVAEWLAPILRTQITHMADQNHTPKNRPDTLMPVPGNSPMGIYP